ncbi:polyphenol oxidase family protein [Paraeggerthella hominis]|uniref:polyphenol oxidase family protein n=1 Tax=Paraeggerthella hominis TaxID=2897351 RepID=UPI003D11D54F
MVATEQLPSPLLNARRFGARCLPALTDDRLYENIGVRVAFTGREGGVSKGPYASLNLGSHVEDDLSSVQENRSILLEALGASDARLVMANQVHGDTLVCIEDASAPLVDEACTQAQKGADALVVGARGVAALLCFADCVPVVIVSPTGRFAVVHAGWRGVMNGVAAKAAGTLAQLDRPRLGAGASSEYNVYVGPHIRTCCFETGTDVRDRFAARFGSGCIADNGHVSLVKALSVGLEEVGVSPHRIVDAGVCTQCSHEEYFSYRASGGVCGRHGAIAYRKAR